MDRIPTAGVARPVVNPDYTATVGLARDEACALVATADADGGPQALRPAAVIRLLLHNALRVHEAWAADIANLGADAGHRVLRVTREGAQKAKVPLTPATAAALDAYLTDRARQAGLGSAAQLAGPLLGIATGGRLRQGHLWELVRRPARTAGIETWQELSPHSCGIRRSPSSKGVPMSVIRDQLEHLSLAVTNRYQRNVASGEVIATLQRRQWAEPLAR